MWGRKEIVVSGSTTYIYKHRDINASDDDEDWYAKRVVTGVGTYSLKEKRGSFSNYLTENWGD